MDKSVVKTIRRDCHRFMLPCYLLTGGWRLLSLLLPTVTAWLLGDMTDALLALDTAAIRSRMVPFLTAILLEAVAQQILDMVSDMVLNRQGCRYTAFLVGRLLRRPLSAFHEETGATVAEHAMVDAPGYYFTQISKFTLPAACMAFGIVLPGVLWTRGFHPVFGAAVLLLAAIPLLRTAVIGKLDALLTAQERDYQTARAMEEETMFNARSFLRLNRLGEEHLRSFHTRFTRWYDSWGCRKNRVTALRAVFDYLCSYGAALGVIFIGAILISNHRMSVGALMTGYLLLPTLTAFYQSAAGMLEEIKKEPDQCARLRVFYGDTQLDLLEVEPPLPENWPWADNICLKNVTFAYPGADAPVLKNWSGSFSLRESVRITGGNGSGKTTLLGLLAGLWSPQAGTIESGEGRPLSKVELRSLTAIQEQNGYIFQGSVWENLFLPEHMRQRAQALLTEMGFEKPLDHSVAAGGSSLSPGQRQKLLLARALLRDAPLLILDEPLNHLDAAGTTALLSQLRASGLVLISHQELPISIGRHLHLDPEP